MRDKLATTIETFLAEKGYGPRAADDAAELAKLLRDTPPGWDRSYIKIAARNPSFRVAVVAVAVTLILTYWIGYPPIEDKLAGKEWQTALVAFWIIAPPIWFFIELYFRSHNKDAREQIKAYQEAAQRIWLALAAVLGTLYGLSFK